MDFNSVILQIAVMLPAMLLAISVHEAAHGWMADRLGDPTARMLGRVTLNPLKHLDVVGTLVFVITRFIGWAKPVPVDVRNLKRPRQDMMWIALAGPASNLLLATAFVVVYRWIPIPYGGEAFWGHLPLFLIIQRCIVINLALMVFNLIPIPPLDGGRILNGLLSPRGAMTYSRIEPYGFFILLGLIFFRVLDYTVFPIIHGLIRLYGL
ncbi:MAG: site-2 protease family protein [Nitrospinota bacterium]